MAVSTLRAVLGLLVCSGAGFSYTIKVLALQKKETIYQKMTHVEKGGGRGTAHAVNPPCS